MSIAWALGIALIVGAALFSAATERRAARSRALFLAGLQTNTAQLEALTERAPVVDMLPEINDPTEPPPARALPFCGCRACVAREVTRAVYEGSGGLTHSLVTGPSGAPDGLRFGAVRWGAES